MRHARKRIPLRDLETYGAGRAVRLQGCDYADEIDIHVTLCADTAEPFKDHDLAEMVCQNVEFYSTKLKCRLYDCTLMPDHLHVLLSPAESGRSLADWLDRFKSFTTNRFMKAGGRPPLWEWSANDQVCRAAETAETVLAYIVNNPVRAGLVERWEDRPWTKVFISI